ncbi:MAG: glycosyltransferase family 2 protein [Dehalococcoidia bacterium]|nr:glycosyltransferase family 2 protein [Dehalococcoidia bacterium]
MPKPTVAVIIPNWNGAHLLTGCLGSLRRQTYRDFETIVVDNGSTDNSLALMQANFAEVRVLALPVNLLFAGGVNAGIRATDSPIVVLLNNDTEADAGWLEQLVGTLDAHPEAGMAASKLLLFDRRRVLHSAGDFYGVDGVPGNRGVWEDDCGQYDHMVEVFSPCGGAAAYRKSMLDEIGLMDEDLVAYCEDVDLAFRGQLAGYRCVFAPQAKVYHMLSATGGGPLASYYCGRNFLAVVAKDLPGAILRKHWPRIAGRQMGFAWHSLTHWREPSARARLRGQLAGLRLLPSMWRKRGEVRAHKRVSDTYIESILGH